MGDIFRISTRVSVSDSISEFTLYYDQTGGTVDPESARSAAVAFRDHVLTMLRSMLSEEARVECFFVRKITGGTIPAWVGNEPQATGLTQATAVTAQNCLLVNLRNDQGLLKRSGRIFISGCPSSQLADGVWDQQYIDGAVENFISLLSTIPAGGTGAWTGELVVWKTVTDGADLDPPIAVAVTSVDATQALGTQHARKGLLTGHTPVSPP